MIFVSVQLWFVEFQRLYGSYSTVLISILGYLVTDVLDKMIQKQHNQLKPNRKLFIYSGHDTTLVYVMRALNITSQTTQKPDFASSIHFELHQNAQMQDDFEVKVRFYGHCLYDSQKEKNCRLFTYFCMFYSFNFDGDSNG